MRLKADHDNPFARFSQAALAGQALSRKEAQSVLQVGRDDLAALLWAAFTVRQRAWGRSVKICVLQNARSGLCPEDCHYCSQSALSSAAIEKYGLLSPEQLVAGAERAVAAGAQRYCMVASGRGPSDRDIARLAGSVRSIKKRFPSLEICLSLGLMSEQQALELKEAGVGWVNHNLNTSRRFYPEICSTHTYEDRIETVRNVKRAGLSSCCGGILGMGETEADTLELAYTLRELEVDSIPVNFLYAVGGTPLEKRSSFDPLYGLKALCLMRFLNPFSEIRMAAGRELHLGRAAALALYPANSIFVEGYLTTPGQDAESATQLVEAAGFEVFSQNFETGAAAQMPPYPALDGLREAGSSV